MNVASASPVTGAKTINSIAPTTIARAQQIQSPSWFAALVPAFCIGILVVGLPLRRRVRPRRAALFLLVILVESMASVRCGSGGNNGGGGKTVPGTTPGNYKFMVYGSYPPNVGTTQPFYYSAPQVSTVNVNIE